MRPGAPTHHSLGLACVVVLHVVWRAKWKSLPPALAIRRVFFTFLTADSAFLLD